MGSFWVFSLIKKSHIFLENATHLLEIFVKLSEFSKKNNCEKLVFGTLNSMIFGARDSAQPGAIEETSCKL